MFNWLAGPQDFSAIVGTAQPGETAPRRNIGAKEAPYKYPDNNPEMNTIYSILTWAVKQYPELDAMGWRTLISTHEKEKIVPKKIDGIIQQVPKKWTYYELSGYQYITYTELLDIVQEYAAGLLAIGVQPKGKEIFHIYAQTSAQWLHTALALNANAITVATAYDTLGEEGVTHSLTQTESVGVFVDNSNLHTLINPLKKATNIRIVIYKDDIDDPHRHDELNQIRAIRPNIKIYSYSEVIKLGKDNFREPITPSPEDVALIMYTSGSTGPPKGVVLTNENVVAGVAGTGMNVTHADVAPGSKLLAFLPLAHILEFTFELLTLYWGGILGYGTIKTISDASMYNCVGDIREFKPNMLVGVPAVWETVRKGILGKIELLPPLKQKLFWASYFAKVKLAQYGLPLPLVDRFIFSKIKEATGGALQFTFNGGAAISLDTQQFITNLIAPMVIGYGLTETNANCCLMSPKTFAYGTQGPLTHAVTVKLVDVPDAGYFAKNNQGELFIKGPCVLTHYYKNEEETKKGLTEDGWFKSGDIGEWTPEGHIRLIDRKKNLIKTLNGEYIAIEKLESVYRSNPYILNICVYADQNQTKPIAVIVPNPNPVNKLANELGVELHEDIAHDPKVSKAIQKSIIQTGAKNGLKGIELIAGVVISKVEWTPQNGFLTSAQKLERRKILADNKKEIEEVYNQTS
ncbi:hypothetical protein D0Z03_002715 [Geotrichum reessii]|nr:hypothetical protein D0Z03_002715 [Galactomyces reessii]